MTEDQSPGVLTYHNDWGRTGQNLVETALTPANVNPAQFGLLRTNYQLDGFVLAQPLYVPNVAINGATYNIVIVVTEHDSVYAFDADVDQHPQNARAPLWVRSVLNPGATSVPGDDQRDPMGNLCTEIGFETGITSTPVVDPQTGTLYVVARSKEGDGTYAYTLYALDVATGLNSGIGNPVRIQAPDFVPIQENQRAGLALSQGLVYVAFASFCDASPFHGFLFGFDTTQALAQVAVFNTTPNSDLGGIWGSGAAPAVDTDGTLLVATGNGPYDPKQHLWGDSILKLASGRDDVAQSRALNVLDHFSPFNQDFLLGQDLDLGGGGVMLVPRQSGSVPYLAIAGGKQGLLYVINRDQLTAGDHHHVSCTDEQLQALADAGAQSSSGVWTDTCDQILQTIKNTLGTSVDPTLPRTIFGPGLYSTPAYWNGSVYVGADSDNLKMFAFRDSMLANHPVSISANQFSSPGVIPSISANGDQNGIVWVIDSGDSADAPAVLYAFDATDLSHVLYKSSGTLDEENNGIASPGGRDTLLPGRHFAVPTIYGGKVFVATRTDLFVFGLLPG